MALSWWIWWPSRTSTPIWFCAIALVSYSSFTFLRLRFSAEASLRSTNTLQSFVYRKGSDPMSVLPSR